MSAALESLLSPARRAEAAEADRLYRAVQAMPAVALPWWLMKFAP